LVDLVLAILPLTSQLGVVSCDLLRSSVKLLEFLHEG